jgi:hypothetical protein
MHRLGLFSIVLVAATAALLVPTASAGGGATGANGAEQLPARCEANFLAGPSYANPLDSLQVGVLLPDFPQYWDLLPPAGGYAFASGRAVVTPSGAINVTCSAEPGFAVGIDPLRWPSGNFRMVAPAYTARGGDGALGIGALVYRGQATVTTNYEAGQVHITVHLKYHCTTSGWRDC